MLRFGANNTAHCLLRALYRMIIYLLLIIINITSLKIDRAQAVKATLN